MAAEPVERVLFTPAEAAEVLGMSKRAIQRMCLRGEIDVRRFGSRYRIPRGEIARLRGEPLPEAQHEAVSSRTETGDLLRELRIVLARAQQIIAELEP